MQHKNLLGLGLAALIASGTALAQAPAAPAANAAAEAVRRRHAAQRNERGRPVVQKMSSNVKVYGSFHFAESCTFDPDRNVIVAMNAANPRNQGSPPALEPNDGFASLINPDGSVHTSKWIGATRDGLTLVHPLGSAIQGGTLYVNDGNIIRTFDLKTGAPKQAFEVKEAVNLNGIGVAPDGTMYASNTGNAQQPENKQRIYKVTAGGQSSRVRRRRAAQPAERRRDRPARQRRRREHRQQRRADVRQGRQARQDRAREGSRQRRPRGAARRHEVREQRALRQRVEDRAGQGSRGDRRRASRPPRRCATTRSRTSS